jgi:hypothetical protein
MTTLTPAAMQTLHGSVIGRRRGAYCGFMIGSFLGAAILLSPVTAAAIYMFMPVTCLFDSGL